MSTSIQDTSNEFPQHKKQAASGQQALLEQQSEQLKSQAERLEDQSKLMQSIINSIPSGLYIYQPVYDQANRLVDFSLQLSNPLGLQQISRSDEVIPGESLSQLLPHALSVDLLEVARHAYQTGEIQHLTIQHHYGEADSWFKVDIARYDHRIIITLNDITDLKQVQSRLQEMTATMQKMLDGSPIAIAFLNAVRNQGGEIIDLMYMGANEKLALLSKRPLEELIGQQVLKLFPQAQETIFGDIVSVIETGNSVRFENFFGGNPLNGWFDLSIVKNDDGAVLSFMDISTRKEVEQHLEQAFQNLQAAKHQTDMDLLRLEIAEKEVSRMLQREREINFQMAQFINFVSHQFRNPMAGISLAAEALAKYSERANGPMLAQKVAKYAQQTRTEIQRLDSLLTTVLFKDRIQKLQDTFQLEEVELVSFCRNLIAKQQRLHTDYQRVEFQSDTAQVVTNADPVILEQVLENLLSNGLKYSADANKPVEVQLTNLVDEIRIVVKDYGIGIPAHEIDFIGKSFFRASNTSFVPGIGLGLSLAREFINLHGGRLEIECEPDEYTAFLMYLPKTTVS